MTLRGAAGRSLWALALLWSLLLPLSAATAQSAIEGDVQHVFDRAVIVVDNRPVRLWGVVAPRSGEPLSGTSQLLLRRVTLGQQAHCQPLGADDAPEVIARCLVDGMDLGALLVASGLGRPCSVGGERPYARLVPSDPAVAAAPEVNCPH